MAQYIIWTSEVTSVTQSAQALMLDLNLKLQLE